MSKMKMRIIWIFSHATALQQNGRLRSTIYCLKRAVYILNQDHTVLIRFPLEDGESPFTEDVCFNANDYDSSDFSNKDGRVVFVKSEGKWIRTKSCKSPQITPRKVQKIFKRFQDKRTTKTGLVKLGEPFVKLLDPDLSHIEFSGRKGQFVAVQRNIYSGNRIEIESKPSTEFLHGDQNVPKFGPVGIRTNDFLALHAFVPSLNFFFGDKNVVWFESLKTTMPFKGFIAQCIYDELDSDVRKE